MGWIKIRWMEERPDDDAVCAMWNQLVVREIRWRNKDMQAVVDAMRSVHPNGGVWLRCLTVAPHPVFDWFACRNRLTEDDMLQRILDLPQVKLGLPDPGPADPYYDECEPVSKPVFQQGSSFTLDGEIAGDLAFGGPYRNMSSGREAKEQGMKFCEAHFGNRFTKVQVFKSSSRWDKWFRGVIWDFTWLIVDQRRHRIWLLCVTDSD